LGKAGPYPESGDVLIPSYEQRAGDDPSGFLQRPAREWQVCRTVDADRCVELVIRIDIW